MTVTKFWLINCNIERQDYLRINRFLLRGNFIPLVSAAMKFTNKIFRNIMSFQASQEVEDANDRRCKACPMSLHLRRMTNRDFYSYDSFLHTSGHKILIAARLSPFYHVLLRLLFYIDRRKIYVSRFYSRLLSHYVCSASFSADQNEEGIELGVYIFIPSVSLFIWKKNLHFFESFFKTRSCFSRGIFESISFKSKQSLITRLEQKDARSTSRIKYWKKNILKKNILNIEIKYWMTRD